jgi:hypothetical protein
VDSEESEFFRKPEKEARQDEGETGPAETGQSFAPWISRCTDFALQCSVLAAVPQFRPAG